MTPFAAYLAEIRDTSANAHSPETSFYPALKSLLDAVGHDLRPRVVCRAHPGDQGGGQPDAGLFSQDQIPKGADPDQVWQRTKPSRGVVEVKPPDHDLDALIDSEQVGRYLDTYGHVLVTNLREFALVAGSAANRSTIERLTLADKPAIFRALCINPSRAPGLGERTEAFLARALRLPAPLSAPEDVAWFLASYAREALIGIEHAKVAGLTDIAAHLEAALGVGFGLGETAGAGGGVERSPEDIAKARHLFHSVLVQTLFYGVFSAWVLWCRQGPKTDARFHWRETSDLLHLTALNTLFHEMTHPSTWFAQHLKDRVELAEAVLNRVDRAVFFARFKEHEAVQYFYEPFLEAFDPQLRKDLGVWYTPDEIVRYMVERVDRALRDDLGLAAGLADPSVQVLDPCCGTGAFLVAVLDRIHRTLNEQGEGGLAAAQVVVAALERVIGFEIMPAPYVIAHLQISLYLQGIGTRLPGNGRAAVYLTNALTRWERPQGKQLKLWQGLREERDLADDVKRKARVLVVLGNPPYNAFAGVQPVEEQESVEVYKTGLVQQWGIRKFNLDDLYVRFLRLAERKIVEQSGRGVVCIISNASYVADKSFVVLRERFLREFDSIAIDNLNGDSRETGKLTPEGKPDPSVFSTERNREGIRVGTAVGTFVITGKKRKAGHLAEVTWRDFWGEGKRAALVDSLAEGRPKPERVKVATERFWAFKPLGGSVGYEGWPALTDLCGQAPISGLAEMRRGALINVDRTVLESRLQAYFDQATDWQTAAPSLAGLALDAGRYPAQATREALLAQGDAYRATNVRRYILFPFDVRWAYHSHSRPLWNEPRPMLAEQCWRGNTALVLRATARQSHEGKPVYLGSGLPDYHLLDPNARAIPLRWRDRHLGVERTTANLSTRARAWLAGLGIADPDADETTATLLWHHCLAVAYSPAYLRENGPAIRADFPRVPLPATRRALERSAALGRQLADLLDPDIPVDGVTAGNVRADLRVLGDLRRTDGKPIDPDAGDLAVAARWGALQRGSVVMPGPGRSTDAAEPALARHRLGPSALDIWLNGNVHLHAVPTPVWDFTIGGYQVIKKWLSYRERAVLGRDLSTDEARHLVGMVRRIAAILLLADDLDAVYADARDRPGTW